MALPTTDKHKKYVSYAEHCLNMSKIATEEAARIMQREMAAEWLRLADGTPLQGPKLAL